MDYSTIFMTLGFCMAAYSIIANDAIQTLGTFISSNSKRPWWVLWLYAGSILAAVVIYGWLTYNGDVSYGRLSAKFPVPTEFTWVHAVPPLIIIFLTRFGIPVSTTFLVLTVFAPTQLNKMVTKSLMGYGVAFAAGIAVYMLVSNIFEKKILDDSKNEDKKEPAKYWFVLQWCSTAFLWAMWLVQDLANIYVYMPTRHLSISLMIATLVGMIALKAYIFYSKGGKIQELVNSKTSTSDIRSATVIDFIYALILYYFKTLNKIPMSTTWVFLGLLGGREIAIALRLKHQEIKHVGKSIFKDISKAGVGLAVSILLALGLPMINEMLQSGELLAMLTIK